MRPQYEVKTLEWTEEEKKAWAHGMSVLVIEMFLEQSSRQQDLGIVENDSSSKYASGV